jgi:hypothetical protein
LLLLPLLLLLLVMTNLGKYAAAPALAAAPTISCVVPEINIAPLYQCNHVVAWQP